MVLERWPQVVELRWPEGRGQMHYRWGLLHYPAGLVDQDKSLAAVRELLGGR